MSLKFLILFTRTSTREKSNKGGTIACKTNKKERDKKKKEFSKAR